MVEVTQTGYYSAEFRVASQDNGGALTLTTSNGSGGSDNVSQVQFDPTEGWQDWITVQGNMAYLEKGFKHSA